jgi:tetratricopeptide (TPR) repeat protein/tRNA A-37 threonylcarbamoyl transferase component Bud32
MPDTPDRHPTPSPPTEPIGPVRPPTSRGASGSSPGDLPAGATAPHAASPLPAEAAPADPLLGLQLGTIRVVEVLAQGGMGRVYVGFDERLERRVALKALRADRVNALSRARLLREARILSALDDPKICQIHGYVEGGGQDFLVLELIDGDTWASPRVAALSFGEKLRLAEELADVLGKAHARGIVHRDLKPSNVMVDRSGGVKVLDFGVAAIQAPEDDGSHTDHADHEPAAEPTAGAASSGGTVGLETARGTVLGTVAYMSPEQASGAPATPASDLFSLGLLYQHLFTGRPPRDPRAPLSELLRQAIAGESVPLTGLDRELASLLQRLEAVAPEARPTAREVAATLRRLRGRSRRRWRQAATVATGLGLVAAVLFHLGRVEGERQRAVDSEARARTAQREAEDVVAFIERTFAAADPSRARGEAVTVRQVLDRTAAALEAGRNPSLADQPLVTARLMLTIGSVYHGLGLHEPAAALQRQALALRRRELGALAPETAAAARALARTEMATDRYPQAIARLRLALAVDTAALGADSLAVADDLGLIALWASHVARYDEAEAAAREALRIREARLGPEASEVVGVLGTLASLERRRGHLAEAVALYQRIAPIIERTSGESPQLASTLYNLGIAQAQLGRYGDAEASNQRALVLWQKLLGRDSAEEAKVENAFAILYRRQQRYAEAEPRYLRALEIFERTTGPEHQNVAHACNNLGSLYLETERPVLAEAMYRRALRIFERSLGPEHPSVAMTLANLGQLTGDLGRFAESRRLLARALAIDRAASGENHPDVGTDLLALAKVERRAGDLDTAARHYEEALAILRPALGDEHPDVVASRDGLIAVLRELGQVERAEQLATAAPPPP